MSDTYSAAGNTGTPTLVTFFVAGIAHDHVYWFIAGDNTEVHCAPDCCCHNKKVDDERRQ